MKGIPVLLALLAIGMLVFGCTYGTQYSANYTAGNSNGSANASASGGTQNPAGQPASGTAQPSGTSSGSGSTGTTGSGTGTSGSTGGEVPPAAVDLSGKNYSDLIGAGTSSQCTVTYADESGGTVTLNLYFDGKNAMRMEQHDTGYSDCPSALMIFKGDSSGDGMLYLTCPGHEEEALGQKFMTHEVCEWQSMDISSEYGGIGSASLGIANGFSTPPLDYVTAPDYSCQSWTMDSSKFDTSGYVCD